MPRLTWQNVSAPNFSPVTDALRTSSGLFSSAFSGLKDALNEFDAGKDEQANRAFQMELLKYQDPEAYKAALQSGAIYSGINTDRLSADSIAAAGARTGDLLDEAYKGVTIDTNRFNLSEDKDAVERSKAWAPVLAKARAMGDEEQAASYIASEGARLGMRAEEIDEGFDSVFSGAKDRSSLASDRQNRSLDLNRESREQTNFDRGTLAYNEERTAMETAERINLLPPEERLRAINTARLPGPVAARVRALTGVGVDGGSASAPAAGSGGAGIEALGLTYGGGQLPASVRTVGDAVNYGPTLVRDLGASPMGVYQINYGTLKDFAPRALGQGWESADIRSFEVQDKIAREIWEDIGGVGRKLWDKSAKGGKGNGRWAAFDKYSQAEIDRIAKLPWEEARELIAAGESSSSPAAIVRALSGPEFETVSAGQEAKERVAQAQLDDPVLEGYHRFLDKGGLSLSDVVDSRSTRKFARSVGLSDSEMRKGINWVMGLARDANVPMNYAQAATLIKRSDAVRDRTFWDSATPLELRSSMTINGDKMLDGDKIREAIGTIGAGAEGYIDQASGREAVNQRGEVREEIRKQLEEADAKIQDARRRGVDINFPARFARMIAERNEIAERSNARALDPHVTGTERAEAEERRKAEEANKPKSREERAAELRSLTARAVAEGRARERERRRLEELERQRLRRDNGVRGAFGPNFQPAVR